MLTRIPKSIQEKVIKKWLSGKTRDQVAHELNISGGTVSNIIQSRRLKDSELDLQRILAQHLVQQNVTVESFSLLIRLRALIEKEYIDSGRKGEESEKHIDSLVEALIVFCFNKHISVPGFGNEVYNLNQMADDLGLPLIRLPDQAKRLTLDITTMNKEINRLIVKRKRLLEENGLTTEIIDDLKNYSPYMLGAYNTMKERVREMEKERNRYKIELESTKIECIKLRQKDRPRELLYPKRNAN